MKVVITETKQPLSENERAWASLNEELQRIQKINEEITAQVLAEEEHGDAQEEAVLGNRRNQDFAVARRVHLPDDRHPRELPEEHPPVFHEARLHASAGADLKHNRPGLLAAIVLGAARRPGH